MSTVLGLLYRCYLKNLAKIGSVVLQKKILTDDGNSLIGHPSDSCDLKSDQCATYVRIGKSTNYFD